MPKQLYSDEAKAWLSQQLRFRAVKVKLHRRDQYHRLVGTAYRRHWGVLWENVALKMLHKGWAVVYTSGGAEYDVYEQAYKRAESAAKYAFWLARKH